MEKIEYPKFLYHSQKGAVLVRGKEDHAALGEGYAESPAAMECAPVSAPSPKAQKQARKPKEGSQA